MNTEGSAALARVEQPYQGLTMSVSPAEAQQRLQELQAFVQSTMKQGVDFGLIPGAGDKPSLFQPGAQKMAELYGIAHRFEPIEVVRDWERMFFYFEYRTVLTSRRDGSFIGEGLGSCNSRESKYAYRWAFESEIPKGIDKAQLEMQIRRSKKNGKEYPVWKVPNQDMASVVNTLQKMAAKRSYIHAVIAATRSSGLFTQDVEDLPPEVFGRPSEERSWEGDAKPLAPEFSQTASKQEQRPVSPPPPPASKPDRVANGRFAMLAAELETSPDEESLRKAWSNVNKARKAKQLDARALQELERAKDARLQQLREGAQEQAQAEGQAQVDAAGDFPESMGGTAKPEPKPAPPEVMVKCEICKAMVGEKAAVAMKTADGQIGFRHPLCDPAPKTKEPDDGEPPPDVELESDVQDDLAGRM